MDETQERKLAWLRREIQKGLNDLEAGRFRDGVEMMAEFREQLLRLKVRKDAEINRARWADVELGSDSLPLT